MHTGMYQLSVKGSMCVFASGAPVSSYVYAAEKWTQLLQPVCSRQIGYMAVYVRRVCIQLRRLHFDYSRLPNPSHYWWSAARQTAERTANCGLQLERICGMLSHALIKWRTMRETRTRTRTIYYTALCVHARDLFSLRAGMLRSATLCTPH